LMYGTREIIECAIDCQKDLIEMPLVAWPGMSAHR
jgi:hypothetical protein